MQSAPAAVLTRDLPGPGIPDPFFSASATGTGRSPGDPARLRGEAMDAVPAPMPARPGGTDPHTGWVAAARAAGHPVIVVQPGRFDPEPLPLWSFAMPPNDLLEAAREYARARVEWVHVPMPTIASMLMLGESLRGPRPAGPAVRSGGPTAVVWARLVAEQHVGPSAVSRTRDGITTHALDVPVSWLAVPITRIGPALGPTGPRAA
ncbi:MAG TPA: hypothetical protein VI248_10020 [Kineosporiaceae bacterium]